MRNRKLYAIDFAQQRPLLPSKIARPRLVRQLFGVCIVADAENFAGRKFRKKPFIDVEFDVGFYFCAQANDAVALPTINA
jgi:hypothetical protein